MTVNSVNREFNSSVKTLFVFQHQVPWLTQRLKQVPFQLKSLFYHPNVEMSVFTGKLTLSELPSYVDLQMQLIGWVLPFDGRLINWHSQKG